MKKRKLVCLCNLIEEKEIISALQNGAVSTSEVQRLTGAGNSCGRCLSEVDELVDSYKKQKPKDLQKKLDFGF